MKISKLLVLTALWLGAASSVKAEVPEGSWTFPDPSANLTFTTFTTDGTRYYLYNEAAKMFFASGNSWNTQASLRTFGLPFWTEAPTEEGAPEGTYELWNDFSNPDRTDVSGPHNLFTDDGGSNWLDHGTQPGYTYNVVIEGNYVRFENAIVEKWAGYYIGWAGDYAGDKNSSVLKMIAPGTEGTSIDWRAVTEESYLAFAESDAFLTYTNGVDAYFAATTLRNTMIEAEGLGADINSQLAVFNNTASTSEELRAAATELTPIIDARKALKALLDEVKAAGYTETAATEAIYGNGTATADQLKQATTDLNAAYVEWGKTNASVEHPSNFTSYIVNPTFDNANLSGWSGDAFGRGGSVADGAEHYSKNYNTYQKITGLTPGVYVVGVNGFYRAGNYGGDAENHWLANDDASRYAKLYATVGDVTRETPIANVMSGAQAETPGSAKATTYTDTETQETVTVYVPNTMVDGDLYFHTLGQYANKVYIAVDESGELTIGVRKTSQIGGDWSLFDDFSLMYLGKGADACQLYLDEALKAFSDYTPEEGLVYTASYLTAYQEAYQGEKTATTMEEVNAILSAIDGSFSNLNKNISLWKEWQAAVDKLKEMQTNPEYENIFMNGLADTEYADLADYVDFEYADIIGAKNLTNEALQEQIDYLNNGMAEVTEISKKDVYEGKDMTSYIKNPGFDEDKDINSNKAEGWNIDIVRNGGNIVRGPLGQDNYDKMVSSLGKMNYCFEAWHGYEWDIWQEIEGLPVGMYELNVQGYVRCEVGGYVRGDELGGDYTSPVYLYMNKAMSSFPSVYSQCPADLGKTFTTVESWTTEEINGNLYPNSMGGASQCFGWGMYETTAYGLIAKNGDKFRIGVKMNKDQNWWCIFDSFKLTYHEPTVEMVKPILDEELAKLDLNKPMGKNIYEKADAIRNAAKTATDAADGPAMFAALTDLYDLTADIITSSELFAKLNTANEDFVSTINEGVNESVKTEALQLQNTIASGIDNHEITDAEAKAYLDQIAKLSTQLKLPNEMAEASDDNAVEVTSVIVNPTYDENGNGWSGTSAAWGGDMLNSEIFNANFDYYQDIVGLPAGTYQVSVQGYYRAGSSANDYKAYTENPDSLNYAFIYAMNGDSIVSSKPMKRLAAEAGSENVGGEGYVTVVEPNEETGDLGLAVANSMTTGGYEFEAGKYLNEGVTVNVLADGKLRIGLKKNTNLTDNWVLFDNWKLFYFGTNSAKQPDGDASGIETISPVAKMKVEFFTPDGRKANAAQRGLLIQKTTLDGGATIVKKIIRK
jgi:hypothetical protein